MGKLCTVILLIAKNGVGALLSEEWLMFELFTLDLVSKATSLSLFFSYKVALLQDIPDNCKHSD